LKNVRRPGGERERGLSRGGGRKGWDEPKPQLGQAIDIPKLRAATHLIQGGGEERGGKKGKADPSPSPKQRYTKVNTRTNVYTGYEYAQIF